ncbi:MAG: ABC transporter substrate-binding protein [Blautia hansenii]
MKKKWVRRICSTLLAGSMAASLLTGCGSGNGEKSEGSASSSSAQEKQELTIGVTSFADTLEPTEQYFSWVVSRYGIGETLVKFDEKGEIVPCLAESWENSQDKLTWTFKIREGVKFSNGEEMTPELVKASLREPFL